MRYAVGALLLGIGSAPLAAQPQTTTFQTLTAKHSVDDRTQTDDVAFRNDDHDRMTVPVRLSDRGPWRFLVDTGANRTAISKELAATLKLQSGEPAQVHSVTSVHTVQTANIPKLQLSRSEVHNLNAPLLNSEHMGADGILGVDSLRSQRVVFDFEKKLMSIVPAHEYEASPDRDTIVVYGRLRNGRLVLADARAEGTRITVVLDTGSDVCIGNEALRAQLAQRRRLGTTGEVDMQSVTGEFLHGRYTIVQNLNMGEATLGNLAVVFADANVFHDLHLEDRPALLLGMNALRAFKTVSIDFKNRKIRVVVPESGAIDTIRLADTQSVNGVSIALR